MINKFLFLVFFFYGSCAWIRSISYRINFNYKITLAIFYNIVNLDKFLLSLAGYNIYNFIKVPGNLFIDYSFYYKYIIKIYYYNYDIIGIKATDILYCGNSQWSDQLEQHYDKMKFLLKYTNKTKKIIITGPKKPSGRFFMVKGIRTDD